MQQNQPQGRAETDQDNQALNNVSSVTFARSSTPHERRADLDLPIGLLTEHELTRRLQMLDAIQDRLGIVEIANSDLADLEMETRPEDVLAEIHRLQQREYIKEES